MTHIAPSIMFHHFHGPDHYPSQGSLSKEDLFYLIKKLKKNFNIIDAKDYTEKYFSGNLKATDICLTVDDALACQYAIALEVLDYYGIKGFWFTPSEAVEKQVGNLEIYRYFRSVFFKDEEDFYQLFFSRVHNYGVVLAQEEKLFLQDKHLETYHFYSYNDRFFRYLRDVSLGKEKYFKIMDALLEEYHLEIQEISKKLWLSGDNLRELSRNGHVLGAHSHTHPTHLASLSRKKQENEYALNINYLKKYAEQNIYAVAHPCNSYSQETLDILQEMGVNLGFRSNNILGQFTNLELPRIDHTQSFIYF